METTSTIEYTEKCGIPNKTNVLRRTVAIKRRYARNQSQDDDNDDFLEQYEGELSNSGEPDAKKIHMESHYELEDDIDLLGSDSDESEVDLSEIELLEGDLDEFISSIPSDLDESELLADDFNGSKLFPMN
ncbi:hypothetical protein GWI33_020015 [Rhynchophorus ferrugineus]|uniref:Uncharacterized protein n=1 Tax=Rhynchophorus ferrugineus TaxID=354439 RepID=A0A834M0V4_RHYFE|nr:hypothetical protein GWI33_020015 [Rhynchophorus ferrugineus]